MLIIMKTSNIKILLLVIVVIVVIVIIVHPAAPAIDVSDMTLNQFTGHQVDVLLRHLASSADWQLKQYQGVWRAIRRQEICGTRQMSFNNIYYSGGRPDSPRSEVLIVFQPYELGAFGSKRNVTITEVGEKLLHLKLKTYSKDFMSELVVSSSDFFLYIFEGSPDRERRLTQEAFNNVSNEFASVLSNEEEILEKGYAIAAIPKISVIQSNEARFVVSDEANCDEYSLANTQSCEINGHCQVGGYINPGEFGYAYVKVFDVQSGEQLCSEDIQYRSMEYVGWSSNSLNQFFYDANITVCEGSLSREPARFELWFQPISGEARKLLEAIHLTSTWER
jgi:hypothetical protein